MGLLSRLLKGASQEPFQTHVAFVFLLDDDAKEMMHALPGRQFTPDALLSCARLRIFQPTPANKSRIIDEAGSIYETFILPTKNIPEHIGDVSVSVCYQDNSSEKSPGILPKVVRVGNSVADVLIVNAVSCCASDAYGASLIEFDEDTGNMNVTVLPSSPMKGKMVTGFNGREIPVGDLYQHVEVQLLDQGDQSFTHFVEHQRNPKHCLTGVPGFGPGYRG